MLHVCEIWILLCCARFIFPHFYDEEGFTLSLAFSSASKFMVSVEEWFGVGWCAMWDGQCRMAIWDVKVGR